MEIKFTALMVLFYLIQAIKCKLAYIEPSKRAVQWSRRAQEKFEEQTRDKFMTCSVISKLFSFLFFAVCSDIILNENNVMIEHFPPDLVVNSGCHQKVMRDNIYWN